MDDGKFSYLVPVLYLWLVSTHSIECSVSACHIATLPVCRGQCSIWPRPGPALLSTVSSLPRSDGSPGNRAAAGVGAVSISTQVSISLDTVNQVHSWCRHGGAAAGLLDDPGEP